MNIREWLNSREFYEVCYAYRVTPLVPPAQVVENFEALKDEIEKKFKEFYYSVG